jgi:hypothetical protein
MNKILSNPYVMGASAGAIAAIVHYVNAKMVKKQEDFDIKECVKVFVMIALLSGGGIFLYQKKGKGMIGGSLSVPTNTTVLTKPVITNPTPTLGTTISSGNMPISDINDVIHTGTPEF